MRTGGEHDDTCLGLRTDGTAEVGLAAARPGEGATPAQAQGGGRAGAGGRPAGLACRAAQLGRRGRARERLPPAVAILTAAG